MSVYYEGDWEITKIVQDGDEVIICTEGNNPTEIRRPENWTDEQWDNWVQPRTSLFGFQDLEECVVHYGWFEAELSNPVVLWEGRWHYGTESSSTHDSQ